MKVKAMRGLLEVTQTCVLELPLPIASSVRTEGGRGSDLSRQFLYLQEEQNYSIYFIGWPLELHEIDNKQFDNWF